ncbi:MAG: hypothetical protein RLY97_1566 [Pseudomonadota bacterium]|jgi:AraC family transcriptional regulator of adaptative response/methylated-DNA-[protein]-cysteine methyltransferase
MNIAMTIAPPTDDDTRWQIMRSRDRRYDGLFVMGVLTTGIYCRPSCPARPAKRENVRFFATSAQAEAAGLRACKRCCPNDVSREEKAVQEAVATIKRAEYPIKLSDLAAITGYTPSHFQRIFTRAIGLSPAAYARALRQSRVGDALTTAERVSDAVYDAGFNAPSRFYDATKGRMGMTPSAWKNGGQGVLIRWAVVPTALGEMLVAATEKGVCRLSFYEGVADLTARFPNAEMREGGEEFSALMAEVISVIENPSNSNLIPLDVQGTSFQEAVWQELRRIPVGETRSYAQIAAAVGKPGAMRATGSANGANPVAVLVPCHRVIRSDGALGGYAYGLDIKRKLLKAEGVATEV